MTCTSESAPAQGVSSSQRKPVGPTLATLWATRDVPRGVLGGNAKLVLYALAACTSAFGTVEAASSVLARATDKGESTVRRELERLIALGIVSVLQEGRGMHTYVYRVNVDRLEALFSSEPVSSRPQTPRGVSAPRSNRAESSLVTCHVPDPGSPKSSTTVERLPGLGSNEDPEMRICEDLNEDALAGVPPTSRSPEALRSSQLTGPTMPLAGPTLPQKAPEAQKAPTPQPLPSKPVQSTLPGLAPQEQPKTPKGKKGPSVFTRYREAFALGVQDATRRPFAAPTVKGPEDVLVVALRTHARDGNGLIGGDELLAWLRHHAALWAKQEREPERFPYHRFVEWLNTGGHHQSRAKVEPAKRPAYVPPPVAKPMAAPGSTEEFLAGLEAHKPRNVAPIPRVRS